MAESTAQQDRAPGRIRAATLALPLSLVAALHARRAVQLGERMLAGSEWHDVDVVFAQFVTSAART